MTKSWVINGAGIVIKDYIGKYRLKNEDVLER